MLSNKNYNASKFKVHGDALFAQQNEKCVNTTVTFEVGFDNNVTCMRAHAPPINVPHIGEDVTKHLKQTSLTTTKLNHVPLQGQEPFGQES